MGANIGAVVGNGVGSIVGWGIGNVDGYGFWGFVFCVGGYFE